MLFWFSGVVYYSNPTYKANARFTKTKVNEYLVDNNYCVSKSDLSTPFKANARFMNDKNEKSKIISFIVEMPNAGLRKANEWGNLKSTKIKNKLMQ